MNQRNLKKTIYTKLLEDIISGKYSFMDTINERDLTEEFQCSKTPIREVLQDMCNDNILRCIPRYGYEIVKFTKQDAIEMIQFRYALESTMVKSNYTHVTEAFLQKLEEIDRMCIQYGNDVWRHWDWNTQFHVKLVSLSNNLYATNQLQLCMSRLKRAYAQLTWEKQDDLSGDTQYHSEIIEALWKRDIDGFLEYLRKDMSSFGGINFEF